MNIYSQIKYEEMTPDFQFLADSCGIEIAQTMLEKKMIEEILQQNDTFKVDGDSMILAGLHNGMHVIIDKSITPKPKDIVVVEIDNKIFIKEFDISENLPIFRSRNLNYPDIINYKTYKIFGVVISRF